MDASSILIRGAREHNLQHVDLELPRDSLIVFSGVSGSGKSSLAFDTIFKEGQRRFVESLSPYARQFLGQLEKPHVDHIEGLSPTISIDQKTVNRNPRSTVGTVTEIYDHLRLLFARLGVPHCPKCHKEVSSQTPEQLTQGIYFDAWGGPTPPTPGTEPRGILLAPIVQDRKGEYRKELEELVQEGWLRARIDGNLHDLREPITLERNIRHTIEVVIDRVSFDAENRARVIDGVEKALEMAHGVVHVLIGETLAVYSNQRTCPTCRISIPEMEPRLFSFNSPHGACPACDGLGEVSGFDEALIIPDSSRTLEGGAIACLTKDGGRVPFSGFGITQIDEVLTAFGVDRQVPWSELPEPCRKLILHGGALAPSQRTQGREVYSNGPELTFVATTPPLECMGVIPALERAWSMIKADFLDVYRRHVFCEACQGTRLNPVARGVTFREQNIIHLSGLSVDAAQAFFSGLTLSPKEDLIGREVIKEIRARIFFLKEVGLGYLSLDRSAATLSGGESQRIRLAGQVGSGLQGVLYVLDEPSIGLHPRDNRRLLNTLVHLRDLGNTVLVVEHDKETLENADYLVDVGPGAGRLGGQITARGTLAQVLESDSLSARYLKGQEEIPLPARRRAGNGKVLTVRGARANNLKNIDVSFPLGTFIAVTGVSGSGKSTLVTDILHKALAKILHHAEEEPGAHQTIEGIEHLDKVIEIDQAPIGRTPRSNPATYTGVFDQIRNLFAEMPESKMRGYPKGRFSFNVAGGRCEVCTGAGTKQIEMQFLASVEIPCEACQGKRFNHETLTVRYRGKSIHEVLELTVDEAQSFFINLPKIRRSLDTMREVGLGYVPLGQRSTTLSGGEAQRVKLATELQRPPTGRTLYILDEPTTGLHMADVKNLLHALQRLVDAGNTVLVIEHNLDVIKVADHVVDLGPDGGDGGGLLLAQGTPEEVACHPLSATAPFIRDALAVHQTDAQGQGKPPLIPPARPRPRPRDLTVKGASKNNLRHVDVEIPYHSFTVITGVSGSGKTSLAFDTLFAEGQRRYVESLSTYARRFLGRLDKAPVESIDGIAPAISVDQKVAPRNPRSTVATSTEINDYLRLLYARLGTPHCPTCGVKLTAWTPDSAVRHLLDTHDGVRGELLIPIVEDEPTVPLADFEEVKRPTQAGEESSGQAAQAKKKATPPADKKHTLKSAGLLAAGVRRVRVDDTLLTLDDPKTPATLSGHRIEAVFDRVKISAEARSRLVEGFEQAFKQGDGIGFFRLENGQRVGFSTVPGCLACGFFLLEELTPQLFSFNAHVGACTRCAGLGSVEAFTPHRLIANPGLTWGDCFPQVVQTLLDRKANRIEPILSAMASAERIPLTTVWSKLSAEQQRKLMYGTGETFYTLPGTGKKAKGGLKVLWRGLLVFLEDWYNEATGQRIKELLHALQEDVPCPECLGARLRKLPLAVRIDGLNLHELSKLTVAQGLAFFQSLRFDGGQGVIAEQIQTEILNRLGFLRDVGLDYLTLDRKSSTLSGGEAQRIRLAGQLGSHLMGVLYVLDEPTIGLHPRDTDRLLASLLGLKARGNTVVVVEHDAQTMEKADWILDMGPGAGLHGGRVVARGTPQAIRANPDSITGAFLSGRRQVPVPLERRPPKPGIRILGATANNLKGGTFHFPSGCLVCVTGVSGSGKSTLVMEILAKALSRRFGQGTDQPGAHAEIEYLTRFDTVGIIDQSPIGRSPKSNPASYVGVMDLIRELFASTPDAVARGYGKGRFSFNVSGGRCEACEGRGATKVEMHFLSDVWVPCDQCKGQRYNKPTLGIKYRGKNIADVLGMEVSDALEFFKRHRRIHRMLLPLEAVGLGYMQVGQPSNTMSGGEAQRVKLAAALMDRYKTGVYILDEPTTGLHFADVEKLIRVLQQLVDRGNTVIVIEHNPDVMKVSDWLLDLGPEGGADGGLLVVEGTPEQVARQEGIQSFSHTGACLSQVLLEGIREGRPGQYGLIQAEASSTATSGEEVEEALEEEHPARSTEEDEEESI